MRYFLDTEFIENGKTIDLISIGVVCEDGREFYAQHSQADFKRVNDWVARNVYPYLGHFDMGIQNRSCRVVKHGEFEASDGKCGKDCPWVNPYELRQALLAFCNPEQHGKPEFWGYYADYDWVALCQLFGTMMDLPKGWPMYCRDIKQWCDDLGNPKLPEQGKGEHNALADARWNKEAWEFLRAIAPLPANVPALDSAAEAQE